MNLEINILFIEITFLVKNFQNRLANKVYIHGIFDNNNNWICFYLML